MSSKISALPAMTALTGAELLTGLQSGVNSNATPSQIKDFVQPYKVYRVLLSTIDNPTLAPTVTVLENTLGGVPVWTREAAGSYTINLSGAFPVNKVAAICAPEYQPDVGYGGFGVFELLSPGQPDQLVFETFKSSDFTRVDDLLFRTFCQILVYP